MIMESLPQDTTAKIIMLVVAVGITLRLMLMKSKE